MRIKLDRNACVGNAMCCAIAPKYFELNADGSLNLLRVDVGADDYEDVQDAKASCPVGAIYLVDDDEDTDKIQ